MSLDRFARLALDCVHREYPNRVAHLLHSDADARPPRTLTPAFYGCFDWHSAVHGHWLLAVAATRASDPALRRRCRDALATSLTAEHVAAEVAYLAPRSGFERPYGLAWLCTLHAELHAHPELVQLATFLSPLVDLAVDQLTTWLPKLSRPTRSGVHSQTAFALGLLVDWARALGRDSELAMLDERARTFFLHDRAYAVHLEPDGEDFLSPSLGAADLMARLLPPPELADWMDRTLPSLGRSEPLVPARVTDPTDGRLAHLDGLNLSRAWMLERTSRALPSADERVPPLRRLAEDHAERGLAAVSNVHYAGSHWLGTFATYLLVARHEPTS